MNEAVKLLIGGLFLLSFRIELGSIPIFPEIIGCLVFLHGMRVLARGSATGVFVWKERMVNTGRLWLIVFIMDLAVSLFMGNRAGVFVQVSVLLLLSEMMCGYSTLNFYRGQLGHETKGVPAIWYLIWISAGIVSYECFIIRGVNNGDIIGAVCVIAGRILLAKELAVLTPAGEESGSEKPESDRI